MGAPIGNQNAAKEGNHAQLAMQGHEKAQTGTFQIDLKAMQEHPIPKDKKKEWMKNGGQENKDYQAFVQNNWRKK